MLNLPSILAWSAAALLSGASPRLPAQYLPVPITLQATDYSCGAAAVLSVLTYWQAWAGHEADLYGLLETTQKDGTHPVKMAEGLRALGLQARVQLEMSLADLRASLARRETVILDIQAWPVRGDPMPPWSDLWDDGHYVVLVAMDDHFVYVMDPSTSTGYTWMPAQELLERWHDFEDRNGPIEKHERLGIIVSGKTPLPSFPAPLTRLE